MNEIPDNVETPESLLSSYNDLKKRIEVRLLTLTVPSEPPLPVLMTADTEENYKQLQQYVLRNSDVVYLHMGC